jgi:hypothetical protein
LVQQSYRSDYARGLTVSQSLSRQFYEWEARGRGQHLWAYPVDVVPPFVPFSRAELPRTVIRDDAKVPSLIRSIFSGRKAKLDLSPNKSLPLKQTVSIVLPPQFVDGGELSELQLALPQKLKINQVSAEQFLLSLSACEGPVAFEIIGLRSAVSIQLACHWSDRTSIEQQLEGYFPDAVVSEQRQFLATHWKNLRTGNLTISDYGLAAEFTRPIEVFSSFEPDPLTAVVSALSNLRLGEVGILQILFRAVHDPWGDSIVQAITLPDGKPFFKDSPESLALARQKIARPLFAAVIRVAARGGSSKRCQHIVGALGAALHQFSKPASNEFVALPTPNFPQSTHEEDLLCRRTHHHGTIFNSEELASFVHLPSASIRSESLVRDTRKKRPAPSIAIGHELILGENLYRGKKTQVTLGPEQRTKHMHIIGVSGTGKSTLVLNLALQDIKSGQGVGILDPHGDLIDKIVGEIPEERHKDVILFDPSDEAFPIGFNILSAHSELEKNLLASDLVAVFRRLSTSWGDQMTSVLGNAVLAFLESDRGGTLADLKCFLVEADYRKEFLSTVLDPEVVYYWTKEFPLLAGKPQAPLLTRLDTFLRPRPIRNMVTQKESRLDFQEIMNGKKILLAKLAQGAIGEQNSYLLGTLLVSKLHQLAMGRQEVAEAARPNFYLYIDEFQNFITPSMASILSASRKYHLALCLAHQEFRQLWSKDTDVASAVISNPYTRICFRLGDFDAKKLQQGFSTFEASDLQNLSVGEAIARIERNEYDFNLKTFPVTPASQETANRRRESIIALSRAQYSRKRDDVERQFRTNREATATVTRIQDAPVAEVFRSADVPAPVPVELQPHTPMRASALLPTPPLGRGGQQHKYLQNLIKRLAEDKGFRVTIEQPVLSGAGSVDVSLERAGYRIACEISVSSTCNYEFKNIQKCLAAGFDQVIVLSSEKKTLAKIQELVASEGNADSQSRVLFLQPEEFILFLDQMDTEQLHSEKMVRGYTVKVKHKASKHSEQKAQRLAVSQVILQALKRLKDAD